MRRALTAALLVLLSACSDSTRPEQPAWVEAEMPAFPGSAVLFGIAFHGGRGIAVGAEAGAGTAKPILLDNPGGSWGRVFPNALPASGSLAAVGFTRNGEAVIAGAEGVVSTLPLLLDERGGWHRPSLSGGTDGSLGAVAPAGDSVWVAGAADGGLFYVSTTALNWSRVDAGLGTGQEKGFRDMTFAGGVVYACGWDDGEPPYSVVLFNSGSGWGTLAHPDPADTELEFDSILIDDEGTLWLGGHQVRTEQVGGATIIIESARLWRRPRGGAWSAVTLPDPDGLKTISDIVQMSTGTVYFAAGGDVRLLLWANDHVAEIILPELDGGLNGLAEGPGGYLYAAGTKLGAGAAPFLPLILRGRVGP